MPSTVKICGLSAIRPLEAALGAGADMIGVVFFERSPRFVGLDHARTIRDLARGAAKVVALTVDAGDRTLGAIIAALKPDLLQLHGRESPARVAEVKRLFGLPVMKAIGVAEAADLARAADYADVADWLLVDAKPPKDAVLPGGNGVAFDWGLARNLPWTKPWLLSGGLDADNVARAIAESGTLGVDVSSGVETSPGVKDAHKIVAFIRAAREAFARAALPEPPT